MGENIEVKDVQKTEYLDKNGLDMLWAKVKDNTHNQVEVERNRAVAKENSIIDTKADKSEFSNYVPSATFTALEKKVSANTAAISNKQNAGNYLHYETINEGYYEIPPVCTSESDSKLKAILSPYAFQILAGDLEGDGETGVVITSNDRDPYIALTDSANRNTLKITREGISNTDNNANHVYATDGSIADLTQYALSSTLAALEQKVTANTTAISAKQDKPDDGNMFLQVKHDSVSGYFKRKGELKFTHDDNDSFYTSISPSGIYCWNENSSTNFLRITSGGITLDGGEGTSGYAFTTNGKTARIPTKLSQLTNDSNFITANDIDFTPYATIEALTAVEQKVTANTTALEGKQDAGSYIPFDESDKSNYKINRPLKYEGYLGTFSFLGNNVFGISRQNKDFSLTDSGITYHIGRMGILLSTQGFFVTEDGNFDINISSATIQLGKTANPNVKINANGVKFKDRKNTEVPVADGSGFADLNNYVLKSVYDKKIAALEARIAALEAKHTETTA